MSEKPIQKTVQIVDEKKQDLTGENPQPQDTPKVELEPGKKEIIAYYQLHKNGTAVPVKTSVENCRMARQNALERGIPVILPGESIPQGIKLIQPTMNRKTKRFFQKLTKNRKGNK